MSKRKAGKGPALGPKPKQTRVTLPLYPDLDEDLDGVQITLVSRNRSSSKINKQTSTVRSKSSPTPTTEHSSDGDDDDDFVNTGNDSINLIDVEDEEEDVPDTLPHDSVSHGKKRPTHPQDRRNIVAPDSSSESDSSDEDIQDLAAKHLGKLTGALPDYDTYSYGESITTPIDTQAPSKIQKKIWENKYIDLAVLLLNTTYANINAKRRFSLEIGNNSKISFVPNTYSKKIASIEQWTTAFIRLKYPK